MTYPEIATMQPTAMIGPRALMRSERNEVARTKRKAAMLGGTVNSCAVVFVYPRPLMMVGKKREKLCGHLVAAV